MLMSRRLILLPLLLIGQGNGSTPSSSADAIFDGLASRVIGPPPVSGRITDIAAVERDPKTLYLAAASGGVWKSVNGGESFTPIFDNSGSESASIGAVAVSQSHPNVLWVGTGESNLRNSVLPGAGVYRSTDAGATWSYAGLKTTRHIGRIVTHPTNPDIAYVAAVGRAWGWNPDRGLYKTTDGGRNWQNVLYFDEQHGAIDVVMDPRDPDVLYSTLYRGQRDAFSGGDGNPVIEIGPHAGIYKTVDGGANWTRLTAGLPTTQLGRIGIAIARSQPDIVYAVVQAEATIRRPNGQPKGDTLPVDRGGIFRSEDAGRTWHKVNDLAPRPFYFGKIRVDPNNAQRIFVLGVPINVSNDGGRTFSTVRSGFGGDQHAMWIDPSNSQLMYVGNDNGFGISRDGGRSIAPIRNLPVVQFYAIAVDSRRPYHVYGGAQDNQTWGGPSANYSADGILPSEWAKVGPYDGMYPGVDPSDWTTIYVSSQLGNLIRRKIVPLSDTGFHIRPARIPGEPSFRFNWNAPFFISPHQPQTVYYGGNRMFKSVDRGDTWTVLGPDLTRRVPNSRVLGNTLTTIAESPVRRGLIYGGTDDGKVWITRDDGKTWTDLSEKIPELPPERWITRVEPSHHDEATVYMTISRTRNDDDSVYVYRSVDFGATWSLITNGLPTFGQAHVIRESSRARDLLFLGTDQGLFASANHGGEWHKVRQVPTAPVMDLLIHPRDRELIVATHGRGLHIIDVAPLEEAVAAGVPTATTLFTVRPAVSTELRRTPPPPASFVGQNPPFGAVIHYYVSEAQRLAPQVIIRDAGGRQIASLQGTRDAGLRRVVWDLRERAGGALVKPGEYTAALRVGGKEYRQTISVEAPDAIR